MADRVAPASARAVPLSTAELDRLEAQARAKKSALFKSDAPQPYTLAADFTRIAADKKALATSKEAIPATLTTNGVATGAELRVRGVTSVFDLPSPKLKLKIGPEATAAPFSPKEKLEVGVHGHAIGATDRPAISGMKRELDEYAPRREAAAYAVLEELGLPTPATRVGVTTYVDTKGDQDPANDVTEAGHSTLLVESIDAMAKRWGGRELDEEDFQGRTFKLRKEDSSFLKAGEALVGNLDYSTDVGWSNDPTFDAVTVAPHNAKVLQLPDGSVRLAPTDFDLSGWVSQSYSSWMGPNQMVDAVVEAVRDLPVDRQMAFCERLLSRKDAVLARLTSYPLLEGDPHRAFMLERVDAFFNIVQREADGLKNGLAGL